MVYHSGNQMIDAYLLCEKAQLAPGMHVADFGCGRTGHIIYPAATIVGERGVVYAVDILKGILEYIKRGARANALYNIYTVWSNLEKIGGTAIPAGSLDVGFVVNTLVQSDRREYILNEVNRLMKDKSRLVVADWRKKGLPFGPADNDFVDFAEILSWGRKNNWAVQEDFAFGPYHRAVIFYKNN